MSEPESAPPSVPVPSGRGGALSAVLIGLCLIPFALLLTIFLPLGTIVYAIIAAVKTNQGEDFRYWLIGDWVRSTYSG